MSRVRFLSPARSCVAIAGSPAIPALLGRCNALEASRVLLPWGRCGRWGGWDSRSRRRGRRRPLSATTAASPDLTNLELVRRRGDRVLAEHDLELPFAGVDRGPQDPDHGRRGEAEGLGR